MPFDQLAPVELRRGAYRVSTDPALLDPTAIHAYLATSYWATDIPLELVRRSLEASLNFGLYQGSTQVGLARVISDYATFAASRAPGPPALHAGDRGRARTVPALRLRRAGRAGTDHGDCSAKPL
jgi:hypothetical protein